jgi:hypothetical protein
MALFVLPFCSIWSKKIPHARTAAGNRAVKHLSSYKEKPFDSGGRKTISWNIGVQSRTKEDLIRIDVPNPGNSLLVHEQRFQPAPPVLEEPTKIFQRDRQGVVTESSGDIPVEALLIQQRQPTESARIPISHLRLPAAGERHTHMHMLWMSDLRRWEQQQARHAQFGHDIAHSLFLDEPNGHTFSISLHMLHESPGVPGNRPEPLPDNIGPAYPTIGQPGADERSTDLTGDDFGLRQFRHISHSS